MKRIIIILSMSASLLVGNAQSLEQSIEIDETVVRSTRTEVNSMGLPLSVTVLSDSLIQSNHQQSLLPQLSEYVPGLFVSQRGVMGYGVSTGAAGGIKIRGIGGSPTSSVMVVIDGAPQFMGIMGHPMADSYLSNSTKKVEVIRGPQSMQYGSGAVGGVINIVTNRAEKDGVSGYANLMYGSYNTLESSAGVSIKQDALSATASLTYNQSDGHRENMEFDQLGGFLKLGYDNGGAWRVDGDINVTNYNASNPGAESKTINDNDSEILRGVASINILNNYEKSSGGTNLYYNFGHHHINEGYFDGGKPLDFRFESRDAMAGIALHQNYEYSKGGIVTLGLDYRYMGGYTWNYFLNGSEDRDLLDEDFSEMAAYLNLSQELTSRLSINAGVRIDTRLGEDNVWVPSAGLSYKSSEKSWLRAIASKGFRYPTIRELYMTAMQNPDLKSESLMSYELSYEQSMLKGAIQLDAALFYIDGTNLIQTEIVNSRPKFTNSFDVDNWGIELSLNGKLWRNLSLMSNYSYLNMRKAVIAAPEHKLYLGLGYSLPRWSFSSGVQYVAGLYTQLSPTELQQDFVLLNASVSFKATDIVTIYARGENLTNSKYEINSGYSMPGATCFGGVRVQF